MFIKLLGSLTQNIEYFFIKKCNYNKVFYQGNNIRYLLHKFTQQTFTFVFYLTNLEYEE